VNIAKVKGGNDKGDCGTVSLVGVPGIICRLITSTKARKIHGDATISSGGESRYPRFIESTPRWLAVEKQKRASLLGGGRSLINDGETEWIVNAWRVPAHGGCRVGLGEINGGELPWCWAVNHDDRRSVVDVMKVTGLRSLIQAGGELWAVP
jgi:hypothetical protein